MKKLLLVVDVKGWAFDHIAKYLKDLLKSKYDISIIYAENFSNYNDLYNEIVENHKDVELVHFFYRIYLRDFIYHISLDDPINKGHLFLDKAFTTGVAEGRFLKEEHLDDNIFLYNFVDNYYVISKKLYNSYIDISQYSSPWHEVIYDNISLPKKFNSPVFENKEEILSVTWIGNSKGGDKYFGKEYDLKGFNNLVKPIFDELPNKIKIKANIVDGNQGFKSQDEVFKILQSTDILLICSKDEGTPLPVIEAMASGCVIVSTDVGIVPEILPDSQKRFIVSTKEDFVNSILELNANRELLLKLKKDNYQSYKKIFLNSTNFIEKWSELIEDSINKSRRKYRIAEKRDVFTRILIDYLLKFKLVPGKKQDILKYISKFKILRKFIFKLYFLRKNFFNSLFFIKEKMRKMSQTEEQVFSKIYDVNFWTEGSGPGSTISNTVEYREILQECFYDSRYKTYVDLGCGDWQFMKLIDIPDDKIYKGYDIVKSVIENNKQNFAKDNINFYHNINIDNIEEADLLIIKDVLIHWPNSRVQYFIENILPKFKNALITCDYNEDDLNTDIKFGNFRSIDLSKPPFSVKGIEEIKEYTAHGCLKKIYLYKNPKFI